jgi:hypothetical protein
MIWTGYNGQAQKTMARILFEVNQEVNSVSHGINQLEIS